MRSRSFWAAAACGLTMVLCSQMALARGHAAHHHASHHHAGHHAGHHVGHHVGHHAHHHPSHRPHTHKVGTGTHKAATGIHKGASGAHTAGVGTHRGGHTTHFAHHDPHRNLTVSRHHQYYGGGGGYYTTSGGRYYGGGYGNNYGGGYGNNYGGGAYGTAYGNNYGYNTIAADRAALQLAMAEHNAAAIQQAEAQLQADETRLGLPVTNFPAGSPAVASGPVVGGAAPAVAGGSAVVHGPAVGSVAPVGSAPAVAKAGSGGRNKQLEGVHHQVEHMWRTTHLDRSHLAGGKPASQAPATTPPAAKS